MQTTTEVCRYIAESIVISLRGEYEKKGIPECTGLSVEKDQRLISNPSFVNSYRNADGTVTHIYIIYLNAYDGGFRADNRYHLIVHGQFNVLNKTLQPTPSTYAVIEEIEPTGNSLSQLIALSNADGGSICIPCPIDLSIRRFRWEGESIVWDDGDPTTLLAAQASSA